MISKSITLNMEISEKKALWAVGCIIAGVVIGGFIMIPLLAAGVIFLLLSCYELFYKSMFCEEAYTNMMVPVSIKAMVTGKIITASFWMLLLFAILYGAMNLPPEKFWPSDAETGLSAGAYLLQIRTGVTDAVADGKILQGEVLYERSDLMGAAIYQVLMPVIMLVQSVYMASLFQFGAVMKHLLDPQRRHAMVSVLVIGGMILAGALISALTTGLDQALSGSAYTLWSALAELIVPAVAATGMFAGTIKLLERKYSL